MYCVDGGTDSGAMTAILRHLLDTAMFTYRDDELQALCRHDIITSTMDRKIQNHTAMTCVSDVKLLQVIAIPGQEISREVVLPVCLLMP